jgi:hypothetical protein
MIGSNRAALKALMNEKFTEIDTPDTYANRICSFVQGLVYGDILPYLYDHLPDSIEMKIRIANPANLDAFFDEVRNKWLESEENLIHFPVHNQLLLSVFLYKNNMFRLTLKIINLNTI